MSDASTRYVIFPLAGERFALDSALVTELIMACPVYTFPHTMQSLEGVLIRRGRVIPVCDLRGAFGHGAERNLYVIARCNFLGKSQSVAIPVQGQCELTVGERLPAPPGVTFAIGLLRTLAGTFPLLDLDRVVAHCVQPAMEVAGESRA